MADDGAHVGHVLTAADVAGAAVRVAEPELVGGVLHWVTSAPDGSGGSTLVTASPDGTVRTVSPPGVSIRSRLYGYGADAWCATDLGLVGIDAATQQLCRLTADVAAPLGARPSPGDTLGDPVAVPGAPFVVVVAEHRTLDGATRGLDAVHLETGASASLLAVEGWCAEPAVSADGRRLAWLRWPARTMPWDAAELWVGALELEGDVLVCRSPRRVDGGPRTSVGQPTWRPDGSLAYVSEAAGYWQPWVCDTGGVRRRLCARRAEFQRPRWLTCQWLAALATDGSLACAFADDDGEHVGVLAPDGALREVDQPCVRVDGVCADSDAMAWVGATPAATGVVLAADARGERVREVVGARTLTVPIPAPSTFRFVHDGERVDGALWRPIGADGPVPLVVTVHPGPTGAVDRSYSPIVHLLCANGVAVASCDFAGSTSHGRAHRERLLARFGELDVAQCVAAARHLVDAGVARADAVFVRGTSAGGTTALLSLATGSVLGAVAWYPASSFADDGGGFEEGYLAGLLGAATPAERSPLARAGELSGRALIVQGELDEIVGLDESRRLVDALSGSLESVELLVVPGEGHGFRTTTGRAAALEAELAFYLAAIREVSGAARGDRYDSDAAGSPARHECP